MNDEELDFISAQAPTLFAQLEQTMLNVLEIERRREASRKANPVCIPIGVNVDIQRPGSVFDGWDLSKLLVYNPLVLTNQDDSSENGVYTWVGNDVPLERVQEND